jgi:hypothetical protein
MDAQTQMTALMGTGTGGTILTILYIFYKTFVGKKCRSRCCGRDIEMGMSVEDMTPPSHTTERFEVKNPAHKDEVKGLPLSVVVP